MLSLSHSFLYSIWVSLTRGKRQKATQKLIEWQTGEVSLNTLTQTPLLKHTDTSWANCAARWGPRPCVPPSLADRIIGKEVEYKHLFSLSHKSRMHFLIEERGSEKLHSVACILSRAMATKAKLYLNLRLRLFGPLLTAQCSLHSHCSCQKSPLLKQKAFRPVNKCLVTLCLLQEERDTSHRAIKGPFNSLSSLSLWPFRTRALIININISININCCYPVATCEWVTQVSTGHSLPTGRLSFGCWFIAFTLSSLAKLVKEGENDTHTHSLGIPHAVHLLCQVIFVLLPLPGKTHVHRGRKERQWKLQTSTVNKNSSRVGGWPGRKEKEKDRLVMRHWQLRWGSPDCRLDPKLDHLFIECLSLFSLSHSLSLALYVFLSLSLSLFRFLSPLLHFTSQFFVFAWVTVSTWLRFTLSSLNCIGSIITLLVSRFAVWHFLWSSPSNWCVYT